MIEEKELDLLETRANKLIQGRAGRSAWLPATEVLRLIHEIRESRKVLEAIQEEIRPESEKEAP